MKLRDIEGLKIDDEDMEKFGRFQWYKIVNKRRKDGTPYQTYVRRESMVNGIPRRTVYLHREITQAKKGDVTDHINGDPLDNRKANLRLTTHSGNQFNTPSAKGVRLMPSGKWRARVMLNRKYIYIGNYSTYEEARVAYLAKKKEITDEIYGL